MTLSESHPHALDVVVRREKRRKTATGQIRGRAIEVTLPAHWPKAYATPVQTRLVTQLQNQFAQDVALVHQAMGPFLTFTLSQDLGDWVHALNAETFGLPLAGVRLGASKYTRLAQMNVKNRVMTVSRYCTDRVPHGALRYLVLHELAHLHEANHSRAFWAWVAQFDPHYKHHRKLIQAVHRVRVYEACDGLAAAAKPRPQQLTFWEKLRHSVF